MYFPLLKISPGKTCFCLISGKRTNKLRFLSFIRILLSALRLKSIFVFQCSSEIKLPDNCFYLRAYSMFERYKELWTFLLQLPSSVGRWTFVVCCWIKFISLAPLLYHLHLKKCKYMCHLSRLCISNIRRH